ncbi:MAG: 4Fe-4S binding protein [Bacteroidales bacterium]|nr:4Fe-4S binding protein [Bacteroidales bacterium]
MKRKIIKIIISIRMYILLVLGILFYVLVSYYQLPLWLVLLAGIVLGLIFGKVFCRWVCPIGLFMEIMMNLIPNGKLAAMYQYHKLGCPIAWVEGWLNRWSVFKIRLDSASCKSCGVCDTKCYIVSIESKKFSLYKVGKENPGSSYTCSKCLQCIAACPNGSLSFKP